MEQMLHKLRENPDIKGIDIHRKQYKIAAYSDDILLFLSDPTTISNLLKDFSLFKSLSNLQIKFTKSKALNITHPTELVTQCQANFPFGWEPHAITYLGTQIPTKLNDLYTVNFLPVVQDIQRELRKWHTGPFLWFGRIANLKIYVLPQTPLSISGYPH